jgi:3-phosphoglycerate kinase
VLSSYIEVDSLAITERSRVQENLQTITMFHKSEAFVLMFYLGSPQSAAVISAEFLDVTGVLLDH